MIDDPYETNFPMPWLDPESPQGLCVDSYIPPESWFPEKGSSHDQLTEEARGLCAVCPIRLPCLEWAVAEHIPHGIFGGVTALQRRRLNQGLAS